MALQRHRVNFRKSKTMVLKVFCSI